MTTYSNFHAWRHAWDELGQFHGRELPDPDKRITEVLALWQAHIPEPWMRSEAEIPRRLLSGQRYTRMNRNGGRRGEHDIEYEILESHFDEVKCFDRPLLDGVNAYPLVKDAAGGRAGNTEPDLVLLAGPIESALILVADVKVTDCNPWSALVQNLRQLRLFIESQSSSIFFSRRGVAANVVETRAAVIAPLDFYTSRGQKERAATYARKLSQAMLNEHRVTCELLVWDPGHVSLIALPA